MKIFLSLEKEKEHKNSKTSLTKISDSKEVLEATTNGGREEAKPILKKFEERYKSDIEVYINKINYDSSR